jgi:hypothetical protein
MKVAFRILVLMAVLLPSVAGAVTLPCTDVSGASPIAQVSVSDQCIDVSDNIRTVDGKTWTLDTTVETSAATIHLQATYNEDPFITFGATTTNLSAGPTTFAFLFGTPIVPGVYTDASSTAGVSVTTPGGTATVDNSGIFPTYVSGYGTLGLVPTNLGVDLGTGPCTASGAGVTTTVCAFGPTSSTFAPTSYDNLEALLTYTQTQEGSVASWSGAVSLDLVLPSVPEPASTGLLALFGLALGVAGFVRQRQRQRQRQR